MQIPSRDPSALLGEAGKAVRNAYAPYSKIRVGAAALASNGKMFTGCNIENASYGLTVCAERVAIQNAVLAGEREIMAVAVCSPDMRSITPCGACRQVMAEFATQAKPGLLVVMQGKKGPRAVALSELLPEEFRSSQGPNKGRRAPPI